MSSLFRTTHRHTHTCTRFSFSKDCLAVIWTESHLSPTAVHCYSLVMLCKIFYWMESYQFDYNAELKTATKGSNSAFLRTALTSNLSVCQLFLGSCSELIWLKISLNWGLGRHISAESCPQSGLLHGQTVLWAEWWGRARVGAGNWEESSISFSSSATLRCLH